jgi:hypothetical protein
MTSHGITPKGQQKKYMWFGYGGYGGAGQANPEIEVPSSVKNVNLVEELLRLLGIVKDIPADDQKKSS